MRLSEAERRGDATAVMALFEEHKSMPWEAVWDYYYECRSAPIGLGWLDAVRAYEASALARRERG